MNLLKSFTNDDNIIEIGVDEAGRGPLLGRVYAAAVILPNENFDFSLLKAIRCKKVSVSDVD